MKYRNNQQVAIFHKENTLQDLLKKGNPLPYLKETIGFEQFCDILEPVFERQDRKSNAGRKPLDPVFMFRVLFLQRLYGLGDAQAEYQIKDRTSFRDFLGIACMEDVPDEKTIWKYKDELAKAGTFDLLFKRFNDYLATLGLIHTDEQKANNRWKSKTRCRVEHVFGYMEQTMGGLIFRGVGMVRAKANIALTNLVYNMCRLVQISKYHAEWIVC